MGAERSLNCAVLGRGSLLGENMQDSVLQDRTSESTPASVQGTKVNALHARGGQSSFEE